MRIDTKKKMFTLALETKRFYEAANFIIGTIENELKEILSSPDISKLEKKDVEHLVITRAKAVRFWEIQIDDYMEEVISSFVNSAVRAKSPLMEIGLKEAIKKYGPEGFDVTFAEPEEVPDPVPAESKTLSNEDILDQLMAEQ